MIRKHIVPVLVACGVAAVSALGSGMANAAETGKHPATHSHPQYNIDQPRDVYTQGARFNVSPADQGRFIQVGQDLTGVSAPPGNAPA